MISMADKMYIKQLYEDGVSKSEIQRRTKLNYRIVSKYVFRDYSRLHSSFFRPYLYDFVKE